MDYNLLNKASMVFSRGCAHDSTVGYESDFSTNGQFDNWDQISGIHTYGCWNNFIFGTYINTIGYINRNAVFAPIAAEDYYIVKIAMKYNPSERKGNISLPSKGKIAWQTIEIPTWSSEKEEEFDLQPDNNWHEYILNLSDHSDWVGTINNLRIFPSIDGFRDDEFFIRSIKVVSLGAYKCTNFSCSYYTQYAHPCQGIGSVSTCSSKQHGENTEFDIDTDETIQININSYGNEYIRLNKELIDAKGSEVAKELSREISRVNIGGYSEALVKFENNRFVIYGGTTTDDSSVSVLDGTLARKLGFYDLSGNDISSKTNGETPATGFVPINSYSINTFLLLDLFDDDLDSEIRFDPFLYAVEGGRNDWQESGLGYSENIESDSSGADEPIIALPHRMTRLYDKIQNAGKTLIDATHPFNASGRIKKICVACTLDNDFDNTINSYYWENEAGRIELTGAKIKIFRPQKNGKLREVYSFDIPDRDRDSGSLYSTDQTSTEIDCDVWVNKGDLIGVYNANVYAGKSLSSDVVDAIYWQISGEPEGSFEPGELKGEGGSGLPYYARSDYKQKRMYVEADLGERTTVKNLEIYGETESDLLEYNIASCADINWEVDLFGGQHKVLYYSTYAIPPVWVSNTYNNVAYGTNKLSDTIKYNPDGKVADSYSVSGHVQTPDANYFYVNGDGEWVGVLTHVSRSSYGSYSEQHVEEFEHDPIAFTLTFPYNKTKNIYKAKVYFKERQNFREFALSTSLGPTSIVGNADIPNFQLIPEYTAVTIDGKRITPDSGSYSNVSEYLFQNPTKSEIESNQTGGPLNLGGGFVIAYYEMTNNPQVIQAANTDWQTISWEWEPINCHGFRLYCDYHKSTKIYEMELYGVAEELTASLIGGITVRYSYYGDTWWDIELNETEDNSVEAFIGSTPRYLTFEIEPLTSSIFRDIHLSVGTDDIYVGEKGCEYQVIATNSRVDGTNKADVINIKNVYDGIYDLEIDIASPTIKEDGLIYYSKLNSSASIENPEIGAGGRYYKHDHYPLLNSNSNCAINCPAWGLHNLIDQKNAYISFTDGITWNKYGYGLDLNLATNGTPFYTGIEQYDVDNLFDNDADTYGAVYVKASTSTSGSVGYEFENPVAIRMLKVLKNSNVRTDFFEFQASNTGTWTGEEVSLYDYDGSDYVDWLDGKWKEFALSNTTSYKYYRLYFDHTRTGGSDWYMGAGELHFCGDLDATGIISHEQDLVIRNDLLNSEAIRKTVIKLPEILRDRYWKIAPACEDEQIFYLTEAKISVGDEVLDKNVYTDVQYGYTGKLISYDDFLSNDTTIGSIKEFSRDKNIGFDLGSSLPPDGLYFFHESVNETSQTQIDKNVYVCLRTVNGVISDYSYDERTPIIVGSGIAPAQGYHDAGTTYTRAVGFSGYEDSYIQFDADERFSRVKDTGADFYLYTILDVVVRFDSFPTISDEPAVIASQWGDDVLPNYFTGQANSSSSEGQWALIARPVGGNVYLEFLDIGWHYYNGNRWMKYVGRYPTPLTLGTDYHITMRAERADLGWIWFYVNGDRENGITHTIKHWSTNNFPLRVGVNLDGTITDLKCFVVEDNRACQNYTGFSDRFYKYEMWSSNDNLNYFKAYDVDVTIDTPFYYYIEGSSFSQNYNIKLAVDLEKRHILDIVRTYGDLSTGSVVPGIDLTNNVSYSSDNISDIEDVVFDGNYEDAKWVQLELIRGDGTIRDIRKIGVYPDISMNITLDGIGYNCEWDGLGNSLTNYSEGINVALGATVSGTSAFDSMPLFNLTDGVISDSIYNAWGSDEVGYPELVIDLGEIKNIYRIKIYHGYDEEDTDFMITAYDIYYATTSSGSYTQIFSITGNSSFERTHDLIESVEARYIKIDITDYDANSTIIRKTDGSFSFSEGAVIREIEVYEYYGYPVISSEDYPIIAINLNDQFYLYGHDLVGIDAESTETDWSNAEENFAYSSQIFNEPKKLTFTEWGSQSGLGFYQWVAIKRNTATNLDNGPDYLKNVKVSNVDPETPASFPWWWNSNLCALSYDYSHYVKFGLRSLKIEYPTSSDVENLYYIEDEGFGIDELASWRDSLNFRFRIDNINNLDLEYGYFYFAGVDEYDNDIEYRWNISTISSVLVTGWIEITLPFKYADEIVYVEPADYDALDPRRPDSIRFNKIGLVFRGKGNELTLHIDGFQIRRCTFDENMIHSRGLYLTGDEYLVAPISGFDGSEGTIEFWIRPDYSIYSHDFYGTFLSRCLFHFVSNSGDVFGALFSFRGLEVYRGNYKDDSLTSINFRALSSNLIDTVNHLAFVVSNNGTKTSDGSTIQIYLNRRLIARDFTTWEVYDKKYFNFILGGKAISAVKADGIPQSGSLDAVISDFRIYNYCKNNFTNNFLGNTEVEALKDPSELIEISKDNLTFYKIGDPNLPLEFKEVAADATVPVYVRSSIPKDLSGSENRTASLVAVWTVTI